MFGKNDHPVDLDEEGTTLALQALKFTEKSFLSSGDELKSVFTFQQTKLLGKYLTACVKKATPDQDIIFVL